jgi:hypothetical protein
MFASELEAQACKLQVAQAAVWQVGAVVLKRHVELWFFLFLEASMM